VTRTRTGTVDFVQKLTDHWRSSRRRRRRWWRGSGSGTLFVLVVLFVGALAAASIAGRMADARRTAEVAVGIESQRFQPGGGTKEQLPRGYHIRYQFTVGGVIYSGAAFRTWSDPVGAAPKVCFDPQNPNDHLLVPDNHRCASGAAPDL
jgi:hypothetical protein